MPAHITVLYPFLPEDQITPEVGDQLVQLFAGQSAFDIVLAGCARFSGGVLYLAPRPAQPLRALTRAVVAAWPQTPPYGGLFDEVVPHLTVATQVESPIMDQIEQHVSAMLPIIVTIREAWLYAPNGFRWEPRQRLLLRRS